MFSLIGEFFGVLIGLIVLYHILKWGIVMLAGLGVVAVVGLIAYRLLRG